MRVQHSSSFGAELKELNDRAAALVDAALKELAADPAAADAIFSRTVEMIENEIFPDGCLGPGTAAANPEPYLEQIGRACGRFDERIFSPEDLTLAFILRSARRAAQFFGLREFCVGKAVEEPPQWRSITIRSDSDASDEAITERAEPFGLSLATLKYLSIIEPYFDRFRCRYEYDQATGRLTVRGRKAFVDAVVDEAEER